MSDFLWNPNPKSDHIYGRSLALAELFREGNLFIFPRISKQILLLEQFEVEGVTYLTSSSMKPKPTWSRIYFFILNVCRSIKYKRHKYLWPHCKVFCFFKQISLNLTDMDETPMHIAYEEAKKDAAEINIPVTGSEVVGLVPLQALLGT